ncbi:DgyrCDS2226 [Dimorphilus gyrociliatus]|uniref:Serine/threonine-protein phosphatase PGAM5, mitochondrial n=1 Tax=Dimorphilus gyrociliatus TaxID=2664684 RepID=A0A7I8VCE5_9ANNE|nr:DgyrCDS2226 [Dimorphilus gyrociliatus]
MFSSRILKFAGKVTLISTGTAIFLYPNITNAAEVDKRQESVSWDSNWDKRNPDVMLEHYKFRLKKKALENEKSREEFSTKASRHILLIRHGQYNIKGSEDEERKLTEIGRLQAHETGKRLKDLALPYTMFVSSTMQRAKETAEIIENYLPIKIGIYDDNLREGMPYPPEPPIMMYRSEYRYHEDGARIEAAYRRYFKRTDPGQTEDSYDIVVCHANVIRYFICRVLQVSPSAWARMDLKHASITWVVIRPNGEIRIRQVGDCGHMPVKLMTSKNSS